MSSRTFFFKNCPTERKRGEKNCPTERNRDEKKSSPEGGRGCGAYTNYYSVPKKIVL